MEVIAHIEQKALRLSALLRRIDNHLPSMSKSEKEQLEDTLDLLSCRITATQALLESSK